jgi:hypothetical protein
MVMTTPSASAYNSAGRQKGWLMKQLRKLVRALPALALPLAMLAAGACGSDNSTGNQLSNADLVGDWTLVSFQIVPQPALTPPATTGSLHLADSTYKVLIVLNTGDAVDTVASDSGRYSVNGSSWSQTSDDPQIPQSTGSVTLMNSGGSELLEVNATAGGVATHSIWSRTP